ncbi:hypothetical protein CWO92_03835 [Heyndrickxia camelliae]|uniref:Uncharacterized protein n=1 Tax=Heyndrickxia camelliae TaxID=1707093 RepID=A0A2N3LNP1_9BACI|nr:hypothetical protein CWO92_03835 [Heyndrickxia camelliae]
MSIRKEQKDKVEQKEKGNVLYKVSKGQGKCPLERFQRTRWSKKRRAMSFIRFQKDKASVH